MVMQSLRTGAAGGFLKYILFGLLGMAMGGLVVMDVRGVLSGGSVGGNDVARIEDKTISIQEFDRTLRRNIARYRIPVEQAAKLGLIDEILTTEIRARLLEHEAATIGIDLSQKEVAKRIATYIKPHALEGESLQQTLDRLLQAQRMSEGEFVSSIRREVSGEIMMKAVRDGYTPDTSLIAQELHQFQKQTRDLDVIIFTNDSIEISDLGTEEEKKAFYEAIKRENYAIPEYKTVEIATLSPQDLKIDVQVSEEELKEMYNASPDTFVKGEQIVLSQVILENAEQAKEVYDLVQGGADLKSALNKVTGATAGYFENVSFETALMLPAIVEAVSSREMGKTYPPVKTALGNHVTRLEKVLPPAVQPFEDIKAQLSKDVLDVKREDEIFKVVTELEKSLDNGESLEEIGKAIPIKIETIQSIDNQGNDKNGKSALENFDEFTRPEILQFVIESEENQVPFLQELQNGTFVAIHVVSIENAGFQSYETVKSSVEEKFKADRKSAQNEGAVRKLFAELNAGGTTFEQIANTQRAKQEKLNQVPIFGEMPAPLVSEAKPIVFKTAYNGYAFVPLVGGYGIVKISGYDFPQTEQDVENFKTIQDKLDSEVKDEALLMYIRMLNEKYDTKVNDTLLGRVYKTNE